MFETIFEGGPTSVDPGDADVDELNRVLSSLMSISRGSDLTASIRVNGEGELSGEEENGMKGFDNKWDGRNAFSCESMNNVLLLERLIIPHPGSHHAHPEYFQIDHLLLSLWHQV